MDIRVLWFTETPSLSASHLNPGNVSGGWIESLENKIRNCENVTLGVAFQHGREDLKTFKSDKTKYYSIPDKRSNLKKSLSRHFVKLNDGELIKNCLRIIEDFKPDIINVFGTENGYGLVAGKTKIPVVIHLQGILTICSKKYFNSGITIWDLIFNSGIKRLLMGNSMFHVYRIFKKRAEREKQIFNSCKYFIGRTDLDRRFTGVLAPQSRYFTCDEMLRNDFYANSWKQVDHKKKIIVSTLFEDIYKGLETVLETAILLKNNCGINFIWKIIGTSENAKIIRIIERKYKNKFSDFNIVFLGKLASSDLIKNELEADVFVHPSHIENSPNSICEAMIMGIPVIATFAGGTSSLIRDKEDGLLVQDGDPYSLAGGIIELIINPHFACELGNNERKVAIMRHDRERIVNNMLSIYAQIIESDKKSANNNIATETLKNI